MRTWSFLFFFFTEKIGIGSLGFGQTGALKWDQEPLSSPNTLVPYSTSTLQSKANHKIDIHETIRKTDSEDAACRRHKVCVNFGSKAPKLSVSRVLKSNEQREHEIH